jgi:hypothetical protein
MTAAVEVSLANLDLNGGSFKTTDFSYTADFDQQGVFFYIGQDCGKGEYTNPHTAGLLTASMSSAYRGGPENVVGRTNDNAPNYTENALNSWVKVDLGAGRFLRPTAYTLRHGGSSAGNALRNWRFEAKANECDDWLTISRHIGDTSLGEDVNSTRTWMLNVPAEVAGAAVGFRFFRVSQFDKNSSGNNCLFCCGMELYGTLYERET